MIYRKIFNCILFLICIISGGCFSLSIDKEVEVNKEEDWLMIGGNPEKINTSFSKSNLNPPFDLFWKYDVDGGLSRNCISVSDAILFVNTLNGEFYALDILSGKSLGRVSVSGTSSFSTPLVFNNNVIIASSGERGNSIFSYNLIRGEASWQRNTGWIESSPVMTDENVIISTVFGAVYRLNAKDGKIIWKSQLKNPLSSFYTSPTLSGNKIFLGSTDGNMYAYEAVRGKELWKFKTGGSIFCDASVKDGRLYFGSDDEKFYCLDTSGNKIWSAVLNTRFLSSPAFYKNYVIISGVDGNIYSLDTAGGISNWVFQTKGTVTASPLLHKDKIFIGSYDQNFYCIGADKGNEIWKFLCEGRVKTSAVIWKDFIFTASDDKYIYCFK